MGKKDNLTDFLTDIANTIRTNDSTTDTINPQDFSTKISNTIGSNIPKKSSSDLSYSNYTFNVPSGYYKEGAKLVVPDNTYSFNITSPYPNDSISYTTINLPSSMLYKSVKVGVSPLSMYMIVTNKYKGDLVATLETGDTTTLSFDTLYLCNWQVTNAQGVHEYEITLKLAGNSLSYDELVGGGGKTQTMDYSTQVWFLVYFDSSSKHTIVQYVDDEDVNDLKCFSLIGNLSQTSSSTVVAVGDEYPGSDSSETTLYVYKGVLI